MADLKITQLPPAGDVVADDLFAIVQDTTTTPATKKTTALGAGTFVVTNDTLVTQLAQNETFVTELVSNDSFVTQLVTDETFVTELTSNDTFINNIITEVNVEDQWVNTTGDTMYGNLEFLHEDGVAGEETVIQPVEGGGLNISPTDLNNDVYIAVSTADPLEAATGSVIAGRFRCSIPIAEEPDGDTTLYSSRHSSAVINYQGASDADFFIRKNDGTAGMDFFLGNYFTVVQGSTGTVTLEPETANVHLLIPDGFIASPRGQYSAITATLITADVTFGPEDHIDEYWLISGDMAEEPPA